MLLDQLKKYKLEEIYVGMRVLDVQLSEIKGIYIILTDLKLISDDLGVCSSEGTIDVISEKQVYITKHNSGIVYNDPFEDDEDDKFDNTEMGDISLNDTLDN